MERRVVHARASRLQLMRRSLGGSYSGVDPSKCGVRVNERFEDLPESQQRAIAAAGQQMTQLAYQYVTIILIGASPENGAHVNHGSAFLVRLHSRMFLGTAAHVFAKYEERLAGGEDVVFEAGQ